MPAKQRTRRRTKCHPRDKRRLVGSPGLPVTRDSPEPQQTWATDSSQAVSLQVSDIPVATSTATEKTASQRKLSESPLLYN